MPKFTVEYIGLKAKRRVGYLYRDGKNLMAPFLEEIQNDNNKKGYLGGVFAILEDIAFERLLPESKYKKLNGYKGLKLRPYEIRYKEVRVYTVFDSSSGQILIIGGDKNSQSRDLKRLEQIIKDFEKYKIIE